MAVLNGTSMLVYVQSGSEGFTPIAQATSHTLNITQASRDTSNKTTGKFVDRATGRIDVTGTAEGFCTHDNELGYERLMKLILDRTECKLLFADVSSSTNNAPATGSEFYASGSFVFSSFDLSAPQEDNVTYSCAYELAGEFGLFNQ